MPLGYEEVPGSYEPPPIAAAHHQELNFIRSPGPEGLPRFASSLVVSKAEKTLHGVLYFGRYTRTRTPWPPHACGLPPAERRDGGYCNSDVSRCVL